MTLWPSSSNNTPRTFILFVLCLVFFIVWTPHVKSHIIWVKFGRHAHRGWHCDTTLAVGVTQTKYILYFHTHSSKISRLISNMVVITTLHVCVCSCVHDIVFVA